METIPKSKIRIIRQHYIAGAFSKSALAAELGICRNTIQKYCRAFEAIAKNHPRQLTNLNFYPQTQKKRPAPAERYETLINLFPDLIMTAKTPKLEHVPLWKTYRQLHPEGYSLSRFTIHFINWRRKNSICLFAHRRVLQLPEQDVLVLEKWKASGSHRQWRKAVVILGSFSGQLVTDLALQVETNVRIAQQWIDNYKASGIKGLERKPVDYTEIRKVVQRKQDDLMKLVHQSPSLFGINRTSWRLEDLAVVYGQVYKSRISEALVWYYLKKQGFVYRSAKGQLTSPDKRYREKLAKIQEVLGSLATDEKFFSIDELGPFGIKVREGSSFMHPDNPRTVPAYQKSNSYLICTAALELSTNQVTHFYSLTKNTDEMIKLTEILLAQYGDQRKLYLSWDAAGWHSSKKLTSYLEKINAVAYRKMHQSPAVELIPLPTSAQFLNVIESVFCGLAKSVLHNSNYADDSECKAAIDRYFLDRNRHFLLNPKRAGNKIWGKELVKPVFNASNNCKQPGLR